MEKSLDALGVKYGTDKASIGGHNYLETYQKYLPKTCRSMLEIGIEKGESAEMWLEYYGEENIDLHYIDLFLDPNNVSVKWCRKKGIIPHQGDQSNIGFLNIINTLYEIIIDDGSHRADHMLISFKTLFLNNLYSGGIYFIEDVKCNLEEFYWGGEVKSFQDTPLFMFQDYLETGKIKNVYFNEGEAETFESLIDWVKIEVDEKLIIIKKK